MGLSGCLPQAHRYDYDAALRRVCRRCGKVFSQDTAPRRIQRKRERGWRMPTGAVYVGRPSPWGNPWRVGDQWYDVLDPEWRTSTPPIRIPDQATAVRAYREDIGLLEPTELKEMLAPLRGRDLACWCPLTYPNGTIVPCHADVLLELANGEAARLREPDREAV